MRRQRTFWLGAGALLVAVAAGVASGAAGVRTQRAQAAELLAHDAGRWMALETELARADRGEVTPARTRHPGAPAWLGEVGWHAIRPLPALASLSVGALAQRPSQIHVTVDSLDSLLNGAATEPAALLSGG
ncbi:MAG TPA: hypothetical protein VFD43_02955, partial [Planctomycetota bacterium]|nr:hypothetical protein [Planctomycetota bacterium]